jgi:hypothetical protein
MRLRRIICGKLGMHFRRIICCKSKVSANHNAEIGMPRIIRGKSKLSANYPAESFKVPQKVKFSLFKGLSPLLKLILDKNSNMRNQYYYTIWKAKCKNMG